MKSTLFVLAFFLIQIPCQSQVDWTWRNPLPQGNSLNSLTYGNGLYVAFSGGIRQVIPA